MVKSLNSCCSNFGFHLWQIFFTAVLSTKY